MRVSNSILSITGALISVVGTHTSNHNLQFFGWGILVATVMNVVGLVLTYKKEE